jgi:hypothetical protein
MERIVWPRATTGLLLTGPCAEAVVLRRQVRAAGAYSCLGCFDQSRPEPGVAVASSATPALASTLVRGHVPAHEGRCAALGKRLRSTSAMRFSAVRGANPGMLSRRTTAALNLGRRSPISELTRAINLSKPSRCGQGELSALAPTAPALAGAGARSRHTILRTIISGQSFAQLCARSAQPVLGRPTLVGGRPPEL